MNELTPTTHVGALVADRPSRARVFEKYGIDYCCGGGKPLKAVCAELGLDPQEIVSEIRDSDSRGAEATTIDWTQAELGALIDHILSTHHVYLRRELPRLSELTHKVVRAHAARHGELHECSAIYEAMRNELENHMLKEEQILFPAIRELENGEASDGTSGAFIEGPIAVMEREHESAGQALRRMRQLTNDFTPPEDACNTWRAWLDGMGELERDLHQHIHKENNILFPRARKREPAR